MSTNIVLSDARRKASSTQNIEDDDALFWENGCKG